MEKHFIAMLVLVVVVTGGAFCLNDDTSDFPALVDGLSWTFYNTSCPNLESIVIATLQPVLAQNITHAAGLLRLLFHDCFVQGCDASILLNGTGSSELEYPPNLTIREEALEIVQLVKNAVEAECTGVVSCADILALATSYAVLMAGGPGFPVPLGRRDSLTSANLSVTVANLPAPTSNVSVLMAIFTGKGFTDFADLVALSGAHTIGISHCGSFVNRLYPTQDTTLNATLAKKLYLTCPSNTTVNTTDLDITTPLLFDNKYFVNLQSGKGILTSDQILYANSTTQTIVNTFAQNQGLFFNRFLVDMVKMVQLDVLTGSEGEIREVCSAVNSNSSTSTSYSIVNEGGRPWSM